LLFYTLLETISLIPITIAIVGAIIWSMFRKTDAEKKREKEIEKRLEDETLYDPETGKQITLEEAENSVFNAFDERRIKSDEEIEKNYEDEAKEMQYILREIFKEDLEISTGSDLFVDLLEHTEIYKRYNSIDFFYFFDLNNNASIGLANVSYDIFTGEGAETHSHLQIIGFRILEEGQKLPASKTVDVEEKGNVAFLKSTKKISRSDYFNFKSLLLFDRGQ
jgi:hypothetical protein